MSSTNTTPSHAEIIVVGAGAAGLQTAYSLVTEYGYRNIIVLEARPRVGGRIHTWRNPQQDGKGFPPWMDLGAAWVHGHGSVPCENPMLEYLSSCNVSQATHAPTTTSSKATSCNLKEVVPGNPWMRPWTVLHQGKAGSLSHNDATSVDEDKLSCGNRALIQIFHNGGQRLDLEESAGSTGTDSQKADNHKTSTLHRALTRHYDLFQRRLPAFTASLFAQGRGLETATISLEEALKELSANDTTSEDNDEDVKALMNFYLYLLTAWYGKSPSQLQLSIFTEAPTMMDDTDDDDRPTDASKHPPDWVYEEQGDFWGPHCLVNGGMERVLEPMLRKVGDCVRLEHEVQSIWRDYEEHKEANGIHHGTIHVQLRSGKVLTADACVVTLPINCLRDKVSTLFPQSPLSQDKMEALRYISMGKYKKVMLTFDRIFWPVEPPFLGLVRHASGKDGLGEVLLLDNLWAQDGHPCWEAILVGEAADWATHRPDEEISRAVLDFVEQALGVQDVGRWCTGCHVTRWEEDPYSRGAYASLSVGALPRHVDALAAPEWDGSLLLAGDATCEDFEGAVHASLFSGKAAARKVHEYLSKI